MERHILRKRTYSSHIFFRGPGGANACTPCKLVRDDLIGCVSLARQQFSSLSKSARVVFISWSPSGYTPVIPYCLDVQSYPCLLITAWQHVKAHGVTRNEPKIYVICYITLVYLVSLTVRHCYWTIQRRNHFFGSSDILSTNYTYLINVTFLFARDYMVSIIPIWY